MTEVWWSARVRSPQINSRGTATKEDMDTRPIHLQRPIRLPLGPSILEVD